jgi:hypothetical protein
MRGERRRKRATPMVGEGSKARPGMGACKVTEVHLAENLF